MIESRKAIHNKMLDRHSFAGLNLVTNARVYP